MPGILCYRSPDMNDLMVDVAQFARDMQSMTTLLPSNARTEHFSDDFPNIFIEGVRTLCDHTKARLVEQRRAAYLMSCRNPAVIFEQLAAVYALKAYGADRLTVVLPYFPVGTMERVDEEGQVATAKTLARMLSAVDPMGVTELVTFDIHAEQERFYFGPHLRPRLLSTIPLLKTYLKGKGDASVVFPDLGAAKRFGSKLAEFPQIHCHKKRLGDKREITIAEGDPRGKHVVVVDDIILSGGTNITCGELMLKAGAARVDIFGAHATCPGDSWKKFQGKGFGQVIITDTCPWTARAVRANPLFRVLSTAPDIAHAILD